MAKLRELIEKRIEELENTELPKASAVTKELHEELMELFRKDKNSPKAHKLYQEKCSGWSTTAASLRVSLIELQKLLEESEDG